MAIVQVTRSNSIRWLHGSHKAPSWRLLQVLRNFYGCYGRYMHGSGRVAAYSFAVSEKKFNVCSIATSNKPWNCLWIAYSTMRPPYGYGNLGDYGRHKPFVTEALVNLLSFYIPGTQVYWCQCCWWLWMLSSFCELEIVVCPFQLLANILYFHACLRMMWIYP